MRLLITVCWLLSARHVVAENDVEHFFEREVRPLFANECSRCHGAEKQSNGLRIDSRSTLLEGGESGPAIVPGDPDNSLLIQAVRRQDGLEMPPDKKLTEQQIQILANWIELGAPWPEPKDLVSGGSAQSVRHWAFQPVADRIPPNVHRTNGTHSPLDAFVADQLQRNQLPSSPPADARTLVRRVYYTLTGLPPSHSAVEQYLQDTTPDKYERLIDRLMASPEYGQHWARHWLDVARYSDTKGYVYAREERFWVHAWAYRDWVIDALNADMPYDRFLLLQIAADQVADRRPEDLVALGFLTLGRRFLGVNRDIIDDRIDVVCRGTMGLTVSCARCHDHKYDPITMADYYSLYGVFDSCREEMVRIDTEAAPDETFEKGLAERREKLTTEFVKCRLEASDRARERIGDYLRAQTELHKYPAQGFDQIFQKSDLLPAVVWRWEEYLRQSKRDGDRIFGPWHAFSAIRPERSATAADGTAEGLISRSTDINPWIQEAFATLPTSLDDLIQRYSRVFAEVDRLWRAEIERATSAGSAAPTRLPDDDAEELRLVLYGAAAPCEVPDEPVVNTEEYFDTATCENLWKLQGEVDRWVLAPGNQIRYSMGLSDRAIPSSPRVFRRGNPVDKGPEVARRFPQMLAGDAPPFQHGSGRLDLARAIVSPANPLTARVIVNRVWAKHFGRGLVNSPSDFGLRAGESSHPELLDWLSSRFVAEGWSLKSLHRRILTSSTFKQSSFGPADPADLAKAISFDPDNRLLWRMNPRRLTFEAFRDSMLAVSGDLDCHLGGKPVDLFQEPRMGRRTIYGLVDRQFFPTVLRTFDFANPDLHIPQRSETTVPQQALFFMNHPLVLERAKTLAREGESAARADEAVRQIFQRVFQREPSDAELSDALEFLRDVPASSHGSPAQHAEMLTTWQQLAQLILCSNEFNFVD